MVFKATLIIAVVLFMIGAVYFQFALSRVERQKNGPKGAKKDHTNYNLDFRRFALEKLKRPKWVAWFVAGILLSFLPLVLYPDADVETKIGLAAGFIIVWTLLLVAASGIVMIGSNAPGTEFMKKHGLRPLQSESKLYELLDSFKWSRIFSDVSVQQFRYLLTGSRSKKFLESDWWIGRYSFEFRANKLASMQLYELSFFAMKLSSPIPNLIIDGGDVYDFEHFIPEKNREKITLEGSFGTKYGMFVPKIDSSENRLLALSVMTPDVMSVYEEFFGPSCMVIEQNTVMILSRRDIYEANNYERFYEGIDTLITKLLREAAIRNSVGML